MKRKSAHRKTKKRTLKKRARKRRGLTTPSVRSDGRKKSWLEKFDDSWVKDMR